MKVLLDHCVPKRVGRALPGHEVVTSYNAGLSSAVNGALLRQGSQAGFEVLITTDTNMPHQQNLKTLSMAIIVIVGRDNKFETIAPHLPRVRELMEKPLERKFYFVP